jgi:hypothetical protein
MSRFNFLLFIFIAFQFQGFAQKNKLAVPDYYGESMEYILRAGVFPIGRVDILFRGDSVGCGAYLECNARSTGLVNFIKDVKYVFTACVDTTTGFTINGSRDIKEGSFIDLDKVYYDRKSRKDSTIAITEDNDSIVVPKDIYDVFFAFYQFRRNFIYPDMPIGTVIHFKTFFVDYEWDLFIKYAGKEIIETKYGEVNCYKFLPRTEVGTYFKTSEDLAIWVTTNKYLMPVKFEAKLRVATLHADIENYTMANKFKKTSAGK